jgi:diguanylate cyclase (GGDEF)-like protein
MPAKRLNLDDFPDSAYAHELRRGVKHLRFQAPLEAEYIIVHLRRVRSRVRIWMSLSVILSVLFTAEQVRRTGVWNLLSVAHWGLLIPCTVTLVWLAWSRQYERYYFRAAPGLVTLFGALLGAFIAFALTMGRDEQLAAFTVNLVAVFFFAGLMFRQAIRTAVVMLIVFWVTAVAADLEFSMLTKSMVIMLVTTGIVAVVYREIEQSYRRNFLENALISDLVARDGLSGLRNRRTFDEHLLRVWQHALRDQRAIAVLMIDIDHFKQYNDTYGHQAGDTALRNVAKVLEGFGRRPLDLVARYGGEEFAVILYDLALPDVQDIAERLRAEVQNLSARPPGEGIDGGPDITVSVGVGLAVPDIGRTPQGAVQLADEALYEAKQAGRNRVIVKGTEAYDLLDTGAFQGRRKPRLQL